VVRIFTLTSASSALKRWIWTLYCESIPIQSVTTLQLFNRFSKQGDTENYRGMTIQEGYVGYEDSGRQ
jgi:hypothetical protein